jgi:hypothetical protein
VAQLTVRAGRLQAVVLLTGHFEEKHARRDRSIDRVAATVHGNTNDEVGNL